MIYWLQRHSGCARMIGGVAAFMAGMNVMLYAAELEIYYPPISPRVIDTIAFGIGPDPIRYTGTVIAIAGAAVFGWGMWQAAESTGRQIRPPQR